jgi:hypothetical protein
LRADVHDAPDHRKGLPPGSSTHIRAVNITCLSNVERERESGKMRRMHFVAVVPNGTRGNARVAAQRSLDFILFISVLSHLSYVILLSGPFFGVIEHASRLWYFSESIEKWPACRACQCQYPEVLVTDDDNGV